LIRDVRLRARFSLVSEWNATIVQNSVEAHCFIEWRGAGESWSGVWRNAEPHEGLSVGPAILWMAGGAEGEISIDRIDGNSGGFVGSGPPPS
jgi:hypothetical protein